jgi:hypothetical protein
MRTLVECNTTATRQAGLPAQAQGQLADGGGTTPDGKRVYEALLARAKPQMVGPIDALPLGERYEVINAALPGVQRRIYRPTANLLEAEWQVGTDDVARLAAWRVWLPSGTTSAELTRAWGQGRFAEDQSGEHQIWRSGGRDAEHEICVSFTKPALAEARGPAASALPYLRLLPCVDFDRWIMGAPAQLLLHDILAADDLHQALRRGGRFLSRKEGAYALSRSSDAQDLRRANWILTVEGGRVVTLEYTPSGERDPTLPERIRKLARAEWSHGLRARWTEQRSLVLTLELGEGAGG